MYQGGASVIFGDSPQGEQDGRMPILGSDHRDLKGRRLDFHNPPLRQTDRSVERLQDYYIVQLLGEDRLNERKSFVSLDCMTWAQLPTVHPVIAASARLIRKRFSGNMGNEFLVTEPGPSKDEAPVDLPEEAVAMRQIEEQDGGGTIITTTIKEEQVRSCDLIASSFLIVRLK